ncbi:MAG: AtpZ/AtpI family protein [Sediminicola sp.]
MPESPQKPPNRNNNLRNLGILSGVAIEMGVIIFLAAKGGKWLDGYFGMQSKTFTIILTMLGVAISLYLVIKQLKNLR